MISLAERNDKQNKLYQLIKFVLVGGLCVVFDMLIFILLFEHYQVNYMVANFSSTLLAILLNYLISKVWVFKAGKYSSRVEFLAFMFFSLAGLVINQGLIWLFVEEVNLEPKAGKFLAILLVAIFNFVTKKVFVFKG
ncbi:GtrA family protein [Rufibacter sediminis]|uniref:GtrA family protein n=1 Tax=Rufibacter sediminis TaxID=2762756 RepID=A0ABR6VPQ0_9BACT|nr:GtrA family protein [Rufibacter sediminis]MBC3539177.1 GtrA family protein [Rufibacter sediminis]